MGGKGDLDRRETVSKKKRKKGKKRERQAVWSVSWGGGKKRKKGGEGVAIESSDEGKRWCVLPTGADRKKRGRGSETDEGKKAEA